MCFHILPVDSHKVKRTALVKNRENYLHSRLQKLHPLFPDNIKDSSSCVCNSSHTSISDSPSSQPHVDLSLVSHTLSRETNSQIDENSSSIQSDLINCVPKCFHSATLLLLLVLARLNIDIFLVWNPTQNEKMKSYGENPSPFPHSPYFAVFLDRTLPDLPERDLLPADVIAYQFQFGIELDTHRIPRDAQDDITSSEHFPTIHQKEITLSTERTYLISLLRLYFESLQIPLYNSSIALGKPHYYSFSQKLSFSK